VAQPGGYRAFLPAPLPPVPALQVDNALQRSLSEADQALGRLDGSVQTLPHPDLFVYMYVRKEAVLSSQIEGTQSSLQDLLAAEARVLDADRPRDVDEVVNYVRAMKAGLDRLSSLPVSVRLIREIHADLLQGVREHGDFEGWLTFFLRGVTEVSLEAADTTRRILELRERHRHDITERMGRAAGNGHRVLDLLYQKPIVGVADVRTLLGTTFAGANQIVQRLAHLGILREFTGHARNRRFRYDAYIGLFESP
jgi:Fic family protein